MAKAKEIFITQEEEVLPTEIVVPDPVADPIPNSPKGEIQIINKEGEPTVVIMP